MCEPQDVARLVWKAIEDDFVLGACSRRIVGFATRNPEGQWAAFDGDSMPLASFDALADAKAALWNAHRAEHARACEPQAPISAWAKFAGLLPQRTR